MIELKNVSKKYGKTRAVNNINLTIDKGEIIGLFGENGAGKTTLMKSVLGLIKSEGSITLDGENITRKNLDRLAFGTCEHSFFPTLTAAEHAEFYKAHFPKFNRSRYEALMNFFELPDHKKLKSLSTGQKNQVEVILALSQGAEYIFLDEPFAGNDIFNREDFYKVLMGILEPHETIVLSTHLIEEVSGFVGRAILMKKGEIIGDVCVTDIEESGKSLVDYVKENYNYRADRVAQALDELSGEGDNNA